MTALAAAALALCAAIAGRGEVGSKPTPSPAGPQARSTATAADRAPGPARPRWPAASLPLRPLNASAFRESPVYSAQRPARQEDRWLAEDKIRHFLASFGGLNLTFGALRTAGLDREPAMVGAALLTGAAGLWKERRDRRAGGPFSGKDLVWDGLGILAGLAVAANTR